MIVFVSNVLTPHQIPFCSEMCKLCDKFYFIQYNKTGMEWTEKNTVISKKDYNYLLFWDGDREFCEKIVNEADAVIIGSADFNIVKSRLKAGKLTFIYLERFYKNGITPKNIVKVLGGTFLHHSLIQKYNPYLLCAGAYCAGDAKIFGNYKNRMLKWGYFTKTSELSADYSSQKEKGSILWVGRLIDWKHPELIIKAAKELKRRGIACSIKIIGTGNMETELKEQITESDLADTVTMYGEMPADKVKEEMKKASIFVTTSDYGEGWGAVLNEAMDSECAVVASHAAGSTPFLVKNGENGIIYESGNAGELTEGIVKLLSDGDFARTLAKNGAEYVRTVWSPKEAAERFVLKLKNMDKDLYKDGPMSIAEPIKQKEMYRRSVGK